MILATNIAESSITIDDISFVIDSCTAKLKNFNERNNLTKYYTGYAAKSNIEQRKGRAGRVQNGYCFSLITKNRLQKLDANLKPEILRTSLQSMMLQIKVLEMGSIDSFFEKALTSPPKAAIYETKKALKLLNALR